MKIAYTAVVLDNASREKILEVHGKMIPEYWETICHHMTINMGSAKGKAKDLVGKTVSMVVDSIAFDNQLGVMAVGVSTDVPSKNKVKHITLAVNREVGGKPYLSNKLTEWMRMTPILVSGTVTEVPADE